MSSIRFPFEFLFPIWFWALLGLPLVWLSFRKSLAPLSTAHRSLLLVVRTLTFCSIVLAATQANFLKQTSAIFPVFVVDTSASIDSDASAVAEKFVTSATQSMPAASFAVIRTADVDPRGGGSNLQAAVQQAGAVVPDGVVGHLVLLTDGKETDGNLAAVKSEHVLSTVPLPENGDPEIQVADLTGADQVDTGETFSIDATVMSNIETQAVADFYSGELKVESRPVSLVPGKNTVSFSHVLDEPTELKVTVTSSSSPDAQDADLSDTNLENNSATTIVSVAGPTRVLLIAQRPDDLRDLRLALQQQQIDVEVVPSAGWPRTLADLQKFDTVILSDVPATETSLEKMDLMKTWVRDFGGGLMMLGSENSFGLGGYRGTPIEDILPVTCDFQEKEEEPGLAMMMVIDKSDSMTGQKIESARQAAAASVELLTERDQIGVIAFDGSPFWISDLVSASQQAQVIDRIARIQPGGGTNLYPALQEAFGRLRSASSKLKHVLILTDGYSVPGNFEGIVQDMSALRITVSTIGLGAADNELLMKLAETGRGRHYECKDPSQLPQIFARETMRVNQPAVKEDAILVSQVRSAAALSDIDFDQAPFLLGYVVTAARPTSELLLIEPESQDPVLCLWKFGLGTTVAFTSDASNRWAAEWLLWDGYAKFWAQLVRSCRPTVSGDSFAVDIQQQGRQLFVRIDESTAAARKSVTTSYLITCIGPDQVSRKMEASVVAPGLYESVLAAEQPGTYSLQVRKKMSTVQSSDVVTRSVVVGGSNELTVEAPNVELLEAAALASGGKFEPSPEDVFESIPRKTVTSGIPLASFFLIAAMILHVCDVVIRRVILSSV